MNADGILSVAVMDDDRPFLQVLAKRFERAGWRFRLAPGPIPVERLASMRLNAVLLDPSVVGAEALAFIERLGRALPGLGLVVCTQGATLEQRVRGLRAGADDWIAKPCHPEEVMARIEVAVRRRRGPAASSDGGPIEAGEVEIRPDRFDAWVGGRALGLTRREFELLSLLARNLGRVMPREEIYRGVWGYEMARGDRSVDVFVRKLRAKLERASPGWEYIHTHVGVGYRFEAVASPVLHSPETGP